MIWRNFHGTHDEQALVPGCARVSIGADGSGDWISVEGRTL